MISIRKAEGYYNTLQEDIHHSVQNIDVIILQVNESLEGNCFYHGNTLCSDWFFLYKRINYVNVIKDNHVKTMLEIGFNAGHSAAVFLAAMGSDGSYTCLDMGDHRYSKPCFEFLKSKYAQVKQYIEGDSRQTFKTFLSENQHLLGSFDCVHIDGGHTEEVFQSDVLYANQALKSGGILIIDDTQIHDISKYIPSLLSLGYTFVYQIPTFGFSHAILQKV